MGQKGAGMEVVHVAFVLRRKEMLNKSKSIRSNDSQQNYASGGARTSADRNTQNNHKNCSALGTGVHMFFFFFSVVPFTGV